MKCATHLNELIFTNEKFKLQKYKKRKKKRKK